MLCWTFTTSRANTRKVAFLLTRERCRVLFDITKDWFPEFSDCLKSGATEGKDACQRWSGRGTPENTNTDFEDFGAVQRSYSLNRFSLWCLTFPIWGLPFNVLRFLCKQRGLRPLRRPAVQTVNIPAKTQNNIRGKTLQSESVTLFSRQKTFCLFLLLYIVGWICFDRLCAYGIN